MSENNFTKLKLGTITDIFQVFEVHAFGFINSNFFFKVTTLILISSFHQINLMK